MTAGVKEIPMRGVELLLGGYAVATRAVDEAPRRA